MPVRSGDIPSTCCMYRVSIRNIENIAVPMMKPATFAAVSVWSRKIENGTSGSDWRRSQSTNATNSTSDAAKTPTVLADSQSHCRPCVMPSTSRTSDDVMSTAPGTSWLWP
jgi:hypothetical protein